MVRLYLLHYFFLVGFVSIIAARWNKFSVFNSPSARFTDIMGRYLNSPMTQCLSFCNETFRCLSVNHNSDTNRCELSSHLPRVLSPESTVEPNWKVYYKDDRNVPAVAAWQTSTFAYTNMNADNAVDGNRDNNVWANNAHTNDNYSFWAMQFESVTEVSHVIIYFWNSTQYNYRNTNLRLLISATRQDSDNNVGTDCGTYVGPPESPGLPVLVTCSHPVTGEFLKIMHDFDDQLVLCEVEVYSV